MSSGADDINAMLQAWLDSSEGKKAMRAIVKSGKASPEDVAEMRKVAKAFKDTVIRTAKSNSLPSSVQSAVDSLKVGRPRRLSSGDYAIELNFTANLHRESLYEEGYPEGIDNIIALINNGYSARSSVYGYWNGHSGNVNHTDLRDSMPGSQYSYAWIKSLQAREGTQFVQEAVNSFESTYNSTVDFEIIPDAIYLYAYGMTVSP